MPTHGEHVAFAGDPGPPHIEGVFFVSFLPVLSAPVSQSRADQAAIAGRRRFEQKRKEHKKKHQLFQRILEW